MLKFIAISILCILIHPLLAQEVSNVQVQQNGEGLKVTFDIAGPEEEYLVTIELAEDGEHFHLLEEMRGFLGKNKYQIKRPVYCATGVFRVGVKDFFQSIFRKLVFVKGGKVRMGSLEIKTENDDNQIRVSDFLISDSEVTQQQFLTIMGTNPSHFQNCPNCPVENTSWEDVQQFLKKLNKITGKKYRLPTEVEWEYSARGGSKSGGYKYAGSDDISIVAWYNGNSNEITHPVGQKLPNELGLYDMSGNVWEWCSDWYERPDPDETTKGGPYKVMRGGCWSNHPTICKFSERRSYHPNDRNNCLGFRLALSAR